MDIKPSNILFDLSLEKIYLSDFGCSVSIEEATQNPELTLRRTLIFSAPEILKGDGGNVEADVWNAGVTLSYWIFRCFLFVGGDEDQVLESIQSFNFSSFSASPISCAKELKEIIKSLLIIDKKKEKQLANYYIFYIIFFL